MKKRVFSICLALCCVAVLACGCGGDDGSNIPPVGGGGGNGGGNGGGGEQPPTQAAVIYRGSVNGTAYSLPQGLFVENGNYPTVYVYGDVTSVDDLKAEYSADNYLYTFNGWYWDVACTQAFENIPATQTGDVTLYAKLGLSGWSDIL
jgi:uncharacterized repeat protein (TIGR02543 family)